MEKFQRIIIFLFMLWSVILYCLFNKPLDAIFFLGLSIYNYIDFYNRYK
jgi:hypothetical protein